MCTMMWTHFSFSFLLQLLRSLQNTTTNRPVLLQFDSVSIQPSGLYAFDSLHHIVIIFYFYIIDKIVLLHLLWRNISQGLVHGVHGESKNYFFDNVRVTCKHV